MCSSDLLIAVDVVTERLWDILDSVGGCMDSIVQLLVHIGIHYFNQFVDGACLNVVLVVGVVA